MAKHFFVERKSQRPIDQEYLESYAKQNKNRGEQLIKYAQEQREMFEKSKTSPQIQIDNEDKDMEESKDDRVSSNLNNDSTNV